MLGPSKFLGNRHRIFLTERTGKATVSYISFNSASRDSLTRDFNESLAYTATPITLPARINYFPSRALRTTKGLSIRFESIIIVSTRDLMEKGITVKIGDVFILPDISDKRYVTRTEDIKQTATEFLDKMIFLSTQVGHRG